MRDAWAETLCDLAVENHDLLVLDGDLATSTRADRFAVAHPDRFLQMGIAEQNMVGVAVGLATLGYVPWLSSFAVFFTHRAVDQVRMLVAQTHANVKIGAAYAGLLTGFTGKTHQDVQDLAIMRAMPGMTVLAPGDATECVAAVRWATGTPGPVYLRLARDAGPDLFDDTYLFEPRRVVPLRDGSDVLIVSTGMQSARCLAAATLLETMGISAGVLHVPSLKPVDAAAVAEAAQRVRLVVSAEEHTIIGGLGGLVAEILSEREPRRLVRIGIQDTWGESAPNAFLLDRHGLSPERVAERVVMEFSRTAEPSRAAGR
ncbi:MAG: transketolase family protein [Chloroflexi bacterium]|nr:transketolase family protein [Chloroflexota bacterium]